MHAHELHALRRLLFLTPPEAARWVAADAERPRGVDERTWNRWEAGQRPAPDNIEDALRALVAWRADLVDSLTDHLHQHLASAHGPYVLPWVDDRDAWPGGNVARWRAHQSACAAVLAAAPPGAAVLGSTAPPRGIAEKNAPTAPPGHRGNGRPQRTSPRAGLRLELPDGLDFADLKLKRESDDGSVSMDTSVIERLCAYNNLDPDLFLRSHEDNVSGLIVAWYAAHRAQGGAPDPVAEDLIAEVRAEDAHGGGLSHRPGRA